MRCPFRLNAISQSLSPTGGAAPPSFMGKATCAYGTRARSAASRSIGWASSIPTSPFRKAAYAGVRLKRAGASPAGPGAMSGSRPAAARSASVRSIFSMGTSSRAIRMFRCSFSNAAMNACHRSTIGEPTVLP
ncbi:hypothetical protein GCM10010341_63670 [Streptomyces noursei]|nr:hypothetical protein GCM10010341_63670 [Streptomyces noursei]